MDAVNVTQHHATLDLPLGFGVRLIQQCISVVLQSFWPHASERTGTLLIPEPHCEKTTAETKRGFCCWFWISRIFPALVLTPVCGSGQEHLAVWESCQTAERKKNERMRLREERDERWGRRSGRTFLFQCSANYAVNDAL